MDLFSEDVHVTKQCMEGVDADLQVADREVLLATIAQQTEQM